MDSMTEAIARNIKERRRALGLTQASLAEAIGYSVKAKGIAKDLFGSYENYVLPVQELKQPNDLTQAFQQILCQEDDLRSCLQAMMPEYSASARAAGDVLLDLIQKA